MQSVCIADNHSMTVILTYFLGVRRFLAKRSRAASISFVFEIERFSLEITHPPISCLSLEPTRASIGVFAATKRRYNLALQMKLLQMF